MEQANAADKVGRCPACRAEYDERSIRFDAPSEEDLAAESRRLAGREHVGETKPSLGASEHASGEARRAGAPGGAERARRARSGADSEKNESSSRAKASRDTSCHRAIPARPRLSAADRKRLFDVRVIRRDLVYVVGLTPRLCEEAPLRETGVFQKFGEVLKIHAAPPKPGAALVTGSAYVTFADEEAAARCIRGVDRVALDGKTLRASFGTTKYCASFLRGARCMNKNCLYLHDVGADTRDLSFTKEEMLAQYGSKNTRAFQDAARGVAGANASSEPKKNDRVSDAVTSVGFPPRAARGGETGSHAPRGKPPPFGFSRGAYVEPRSAPPSKSKSRQNQNQNRVAAGIKGGIPAPRPTGTPVASSVTPAMKTRAPSRPARSAASSTPDASGLGVFGAGKAPVPVPLGDAAPREKSRFTFAAERDD